MRIAPTALVLIIAAALTPSVIAQPAAGWGPPTAAGQDYPPADVSDWTGGVDPGAVAAALDQLAQRVTDAILGLAADLADLTYTPAVATDWNGDADPGDADDAVNQLASRTDATEIVASAAQVGTAALTDVSDVGVVSAADLYHYSTALGVWAEGTVTAAGRAIIDDANAAAQLATIGAQATSAALTDISDIGVVSAADKFLYSSALGVWAEGAVTAAGRAIIDDATAGDQRTTLGLGALATGADAADVPYTPIDATDWTGSIDPGNADDALDQLAQRLTDGGGGGVAAKWAYGSFSVDQTTNLTAGNPLQFDTWAGTLTTDGGTYRVTLEAGKAYLINIQFGINQGVMDARVYDATNASYRGPTLEMVPPNATNGSVGAYSLTYIDSTAGARDIEARISYRATTSLLYKTYAAITVVDVTGSGGVSDAADLTYTPAVGADPGNADDAVDDLRARTVAIEGEWDWTRDVGAPLTADWADASTVGGNTALTTLGDVLGGRAIRLDPSGTAEGGIVIAAAGGDWTWAVRMCLSPQAATVATSQTMYLMAAFVDGTNLADAADNWYGGGFGWAGTTWEGNQITLATGTDWNTYSASGTASTWQRHTCGDVWLTRASTTLTVRWAPMGEMPLILGTHTVTAGAGYYAVRVEDPSNVGHKFAVLGYGVVAAPPLLE